MFEMADTSPHHFFGAENANPDVSKWNTSKVIKKIINTGCGLTA